MMGFGWNLRTARVHWTSPLIDMTVLCCGGQAGTAGTQAGSRDSYLKDDKILQTLDGHALDIKGFLELRVAGLVSRGVWS